MCIFVLCLILVPLSPDKNQFAVQLNNNDDNNNNILNTRSLIQFSKLFIYLYDDFNSE
jgi:hypothetical protein